MERPDCHPEGVATDPNCMDCVEFHFPRGIEVNFLHDTRPVYGIIESHYQREDGKIFACVKFVHEGEEVVANVAMTDPSLMVPFWAQEEWAARER